MKCFSIPLGLALTALSLLAAGTPAHAGERPIRAEGRGILFPYYEVCVGAGKGEHVGPCRLDINLFWYELFRGFAPNVAPQSLVLEAANGDRLVAFVDSEMDLATGIVVGTLTFRGGTGRFADATGSASLLIVPDTYWFGYEDDVYHYPYPFEETRFSWSLEGTIDY